jgi:hypothetical protein
VFIIQGSLHDPHALMAANAEQAAVGVLLKPFCSSSSDSTAGSGCAACGDDSVVSAAGVADARVVAAANTLRSINPHIQVSRCAAKTVLHTVQPLFWADGQEVNQRYYFRQMHKK